MAWLLHGDRVLASVETAVDARARSRGLLGRDGIDGVLLLQPASAIHTIGMRFAIDAAYCSSSVDGEDMDLVVQDVVTMPPNRLGRPRPRCRVILEAESGRFAKWGITSGDELHIRLAEQ